MKNNIYDIIFRLENRIMALEQALNITPPKEYLTHPKALRQFLAREGSVLSITEAEVPKHPKLKAALLKEFAELKEQIE